jgi:hypothetical protein
MNVSRSARASSHGSGVTSSIDCIAEPFERIEVVALRAAISFASASAAPDDSFEEALGGWAGAALFGRDSGQSLLDVLAAAGPRRLSTSVAIHAVAHDRRVCTKEASRAVKATPAGRGRMTRASSSGRPRSGRDRIDAPALRRRRSILDLLVKWAWGG